MLVEIMLEISGKPYKQVWIDFDEGINSDHLKLNPMGEVREHKKMSAEIFF
jgi:hypothetical protein